MTRLNDHPTYTEHWDFDVWIILVNRQRWYAFWVEELIELSVMSSWL